MIPFPSLKEHSDCCGGQRGTDMSPGDGLGEGHIARHCGTSEEGEERCI